VVNTERVTINKYPPPVMIHEVLFNYEKVPLHQSGSSFRGIQDIQFNFTALTFVSPERIKIKFKLEGYDRDWRLLHSIYYRRAHYNNLPPGEYQFRVTACNSSGVWNSTGASFSFVLKPYFYQTLLFKIAASMALAFMVIGLYIFVKKQIYLNKLKQKYRNSPLDPEKAETCLKKLNHLLEIEKVYRDEALTLNSLAEKLSIAPRYLSQIVNEQLNKNFRDLVNGYRIEEARELLANPGKNKKGMELSVMSIAFEVGFNSKEVFNRAFKKYTGMTPTEYKRKASESPTS